MVTVTIRNVGQTGPVLDQVLDAGANNLSGINFSIADPAALEREARDKAIADARSRAEAMAQASGLTVGEVLSISENLGGLGGPYSDGAAAAGGMPIQPGQQNVSAQVQVTFELK
jgi:uncharacterized protein YggE